MGRRAGWPDSQVSYSNQIKLKSSFDCSLYRSNDLRGVKGVVCEGMVLL